MQNGAAGEANLNGALQIGRSTGSMIAIILQPPRPDVHSRKHPAHANAEDPAPLHQLYG